MIPEDPKKQRQEHPLWGNLLLCHARQKLCREWIYPFLLLTVYMVPLLVPMPGNAQAEGESLAELNVLGNQAFGNRDFVSARYYFMRIRESDEWESYPDKVSVLGRLGLVEESQSRFRAASRWYGELLDLQMEQATEQNLPVFHVTNRYYALRYADCLERGGEYERASEVLWALVPFADAGSRIAVFEQLIRNYEFKPVTRDELDTLRDQMGQEAMMSLGWQLANLYQNKGFPEVSVDFYDRLWPDDPTGAKEHIDSIVTAYRDTVGLDSLQQSIRDIRASQPGVDPYLLLEIRLLERMGDDAEALALLDREIRARTRQNQIEEALSALNHSQMIEIYMGLVQRERGLEEAIRLQKILVQNDPVDVRKRDRLSEFLANAGQVEEAVRGWVRWAESMGQQPNALLLAAERVFALGDDEQAAELISSVESIEPDFALRKGMASLRMGQFDAAFAALNIVSASSNLGDPFVADEISRYTETAPNVSAIFQAMVESASGEAYTDVPDWMRRSIEELGFRHHFTQSLHSLAMHEPTGVWKIQLARSAVNHGKDDWALRLLNAVDEDSPYQQAAQQEKAFLLRHAEEIYKRKEAARLLRATMGPILSSTASMKISPLMVTRIMDYAETQLRAFEPEEALKAVIRIEQATESLTHPLLPADRERLRFARSHIWMQLASWDAALEGFRSIESMPMKTDALWFQAMIHLARTDVGEAIVLLQSIVETPEHWPRANDALRMLTILDPLVGEALELFCQAQLLQLQGRFEDAVPVLRSLAVQQYGNDEEEWARYWIGDLFQHEGNLAEASDEWSRLLLDVDHPIIHGMIRLQLLEPELAEDEIAAMTGYQQLLNEFPESLFADLARLDIQVQENDTP